MSASADQLFNVVPNFPTKTVKVPELGDLEVKIRALSLDSSSELGELVTPESGRPSRKFNHAMIAMSVVNDEGHLVFDAENAEHLARIGGWPRAATERITAAINELSGAAATPDPDEAIEKAEGNS